MQAIGSISVTSRGQVLLSGLQYQFSIYDSDANLVRIVRLAAAGPMVLVHRVVETSSGTFIVWYSDGNFENDNRRHAMYGVLNFKESILRHGISEVTISGDVIRSYDARQDEQEYQVLDTDYLTIDDKDNIYVADQHNERVLILNSTLCLRRIIQTQKLQRESPARLYFSKDTSQLIVGLTDRRVDVWNITNE